MNQTTSSLSLDKTDLECRVTRSMLFDSLRHDLLVMELNKDVDRSDSIMQKLQQVKEYSINEA